jgi:hypothetical protein
MDRYKDRLQNIPEPGGNGCHPSLLSVANTGILAGLPASIIFEDMRKAIPTGGRHVTDRELWDAINKAAADLSGGTLNIPPKPKPIIKDGRGTLRNIIKKAEIKNEMDLMELSPIRLLGRVKDDAALFLKVMFEPQDLVFIGPRDAQGIVGETIRRVEEWLGFFESGHSAGPLIIVNPLTGNPAEKKSGGVTLRGDANVSEFRHCLVEFDNLTHEEQIRFWSMVRLPIKALVDSGNKSIHAFLDVSKLADIKTAEAWEKHIKIRLFEQLLKPLGVDYACSNSSRLGRLPGYPRNDSWQRLLWLAPEGRTIQ